MSTSRQTKAKVIHASQSKANVPVYRQLVVLALLAPLSFILVLFFLLFQPDQVPIKSSQEDFTAYLDTRIPALMKEYTIPGVNMALVANGKTVWQKSYGYADLSTQRCMTPTTICRVESISKSLTAWGLMKLVEQGKIKLENPFVQYIKSWHFPPSRFPSEKITVKELLSHNAGMPLGTIGVRYSPVSALPSLEEQLSKDAIPIKAPGSGFSYSNTGFNLLELLIEEVTGQDFAVYMQKEVLAPLEMDHSSFRWSRNWNPPVPKGYDLKEQPFLFISIQTKQPEGCFQQRVIWPVL